MFEEKVKRLEQGRVENLHVICDFDRTLTTFTKGGSSFSPVRRLNLLGPEYGEKAMALFYHYHPMEVDPAIPLDEKAGIMHEWWEAQFHLMIQHGFQKQHLEQMKGHDLVKLKEGVIPFMRELERFKVPLLILSAGFGDMIEIVLEEAGVYSDNVHVVANFMEYDEAGKAIAYAPPIIHGLNKCEQELGPYQALVEDRPNVLLVGDMVGDANMANGLSHDTVLKLGFLHDPTPAKRAEHARHFDLVIEDDESWAAVKSVWDQILSGGML